MIKNFRCKETERVFSGFLSRRLPQDMQRRAQSKLKKLQAAMVIEDLRLPPSNHLEQLRGDRKGQWSMRVNDQWRICFVWQDGHASDVEIVDYH